MNRHIDFCQLLHRQLVFVLLFGVFLVFGCATSTTNFIYRMPENRTKQKKVTTAGLFPVEDNRVLRDVDFCYNAPPIPSIRHILRAELLHIGGFSDVKLVPGVHEGNPEYLRSQEIDYTVKARVDMLNWHMTNFHDQTKNMFMATWFFGLIGGFIYGTVKKDVYGVVDMHMTVKDTTDGKTILNKTYRFRYRMKQKIMKSDGAKTKARVIGEALKNLLMLFIEDLNEARGIP